MPKREIYPKYQRFPEQVQMTGSASYGTQAGAAGDTPTGSCWLYCVEIGTVHGGGGSCEYVTSPGGDYNTALGYHALRFNSTGDYNAAFGAYALESVIDVNITGNSAFGYEALKICESDYNTAIGYQALDTCAGGDGHNTGGGHLALDDLTTGSYNSAWGASALADCITGNYNTGVGPSSLVDLQTGSYNVGVGYLSGDGLTTGSYNVSVGYDSQLGLGATSNVIIGHSAGGASITGEFNVAIGKEALGQGYGGIAYNIAIGWQALMYAWGGYNIAIGRSSGDVITTGTYNILIGDACDPPANNSTYRLNIGDTIYGDMAASVKTVGINASTISAQLHVDQNQTSGNAVPVLLLDQADVSEEFIRFIGTSADGVLTQSIVEEGDQGGQTLAGWLKVYVQDDGNQLTDQAYFVPVYTLSA